jgi:hypothetical protein
VPPSLQILMRNSFFLSSFLSQSDLFLPTHCRCRGSLLHLITFNDTHSVGLLWTRDRPVAETSTSQHTIFTRSIHAHRRDSSPQSQQARSHRNKGDSTKKSIQVISILSESSVAIEQSTRRHIP